jgi:hypothetical protein
MVGGEVGWCSPAGRLCSEGQRTEPEESVLGAEDAVDTEDAVDAEGAGDAEDAA